MSFVRIGTFKANQIDELIAIFERDVRPAMRAAQGNMSACLLRQHDAVDTFLACTAWRSREDAERYEQSDLAQLNVENLRHTFAGPPTYDG